MLPNRNNFSSKLFLVFTSIVLIVSSVGVGIGAEYLIRLRALDNFRLEVVETASDLQSKLDSYGQLILSLEAFVSLNENTSLENINAYTEGVRLKREFEGISAVSIIREVDPANLPEFLESLQEEVYVFTEGRVTELAHAPDLSEAVSDINTVNGNYYILQYIAPSDDDTIAIAGVNLAREANRKAALIKALNQEESVATADISFATGAEGFLVFKRIEKENSSATDLLTFSFRSSDFYRALLKDLLNTSDVNVLLKDSDSGEVVFQENNTLNPFYSENIYLDFAGRQFVFTLEVDKNFRQISAATSLPFILSGVVGIASALILMFIVNLNKSREDTEKLAADSVSRVERLEDQLQTILDNTSIMVYVKSKSGKYQLVNKEFGRLIDGSTEDMIGKTDFDIFPAQVAARIVENDRRVIDMGKQLRFEEKIPAKDGKEEIYYSQKFPLLNEQNEVYAIGGVSTNVTEQKANTEKLEQRKTELERVNAMMIDRELKMIELKEQITNLKRRIEGEQQD